MNEKSTYELDKILSSVEPEHFNRYRNEEDTDSQMSVSEFFNWYIGCHGLQLSDVIRQSDIPANYAYGILNGKPRQSNCALHCMSYESYGYQPCVKNCRLKPSVFQGQPRCCNYNYD